MTLLRLAILATSLVPAVAFASGAPGGDGLVFIVLALSAQALPVVLSLGIAIMRGVRRGWRHGLRFLAASAGVVLAASVIGWMLLFMLGPLVPPDSLALPLAGVVGLPVLAWAIHLWRTVAGDRAAWSDVRR